MYSTKELMDTAFNVLLEGVPDNIDYEKLRGRLSGIEGEYFPGSWYGTVIDPYPRPPEGSRRTYLTYRFLKCKISIISCKFDARLID